MTENRKTEQCSVSWCDVINENNTDGERNIHLEMEHCSISPSSLDNSFPVKYYRHKPGSIPVIIRSYKSICTREIHKLEKYKRFKWQSSFYDQVIFDEQYFQNTKIYIRNNPKNSSHKQNPHPNERGYDLNV